MRILTPKQPGAFLSVLEVVDRAKVEFEFVVTDEYHGMRYFAEELISKNPNVDQGSADRELGRLGECLEMIVGDDRNSDERFLRCYVAEGKPVEVDEDVSRCNDFIERLESVLNYSSDEAMA